MFSIAANIANVISLICVAYSALVFVSSLRLRIHKSFIPFSAAIFFLSLFANNWIHNAVTDPSVIVFWIHVSLIQFYLSMIFLGFGLIGIGLRSKVIKPLMIPVLLLILVSIVSMIFPFDLLYRIEEGQRSVTFLFKWGFAPILTVVFIVAVIELVMRIRKETDLNKRLLRIFAWGFSFLIVFGVLEMMDSIFWNISSAPMFNFSALGILIFSILLLGFMSEIIVHDLEHRHKVRLGDHSSSSGKSEEILRICREIIINKSLYSRHDFSLNDLAGNTGFSRTEVSNAVNLSGDHFNLFINRFRVEELKKRLQDPRNSGKTILEIALDCGFNSKATLNRIFKELEDCSPREFRDRYL